MRRERLAENLGGRRNRQLISASLGEFVRNFDYLKSVGFDELTNGKSLVVLNAHRRKFSEPVKREELKRAFYDEVRRILQDGQVENYLPKDYNGRVECLRSRLKALDAA